MSTISDSVVAMLLPSATMVEPSRSNSVWGIWVMFASRAKAVAAWSDDRLVATPRSAIVRVNPRMFSCSMPS
jgi:hypothetical protein